MMIQMILLIILKMIFKKKSFFLVKKKSCLKQNKRKNQFSNYLNIKLCAFSVKELMRKLSLVSTKKQNNELRSKFIKSSSSMI
jgi:hypothetical protein